MLQITIPEQEYFIEATNEFVTIPGQTIELEHSLVSVSKWESKWNKEFLSNKDKTNEEVLDYIKCMTLTPNVDPLIYMGITKDQIKEITDYINAPMSATHPPIDENGPKSREIVTSELIYYWMIALNIPIEFENWHLNRLITMIRVCEIKNKPPKSMSKKQVANRNSSLNAARRARMHSRG